ncbi:DUF2526 family protein [Pantoea cypripedii]|uniref:DUF2526 domain-containing protein n=1 Tax=Pantoea cypripedii TaxID=55209 RepID=A0A1X1EGP1_PANCY|nr:DUF2526 family protein [Pantoea cypripedii]MBP2199759.1 hypothetical protein [Pantoea cypripedii]ORM87972.1 hypothetical protein HA50_28970 [Pantoea cypripedii]
MKHRDEVFALVEAAIQNNVIREMNELLGQLSSDTELSREDRFAAQQRLRQAVFMRDREKEELAAQRHKWLTRGGIIK